MYPNQGRYSFALLLPKFEKDIILNRSSRPQVFCKKGVLENFRKFTGKHLWSLFFKKEALALLFSGEFCEFFKNIFFYRTPLVVASDLMALSEFFQTRIRFK